MISLPRKYSVLLPLTILAALLWLSYNLKADEDGDELLTCPGPSSIHHEPSRSYRDSLSTVLPSDRAPHSKTLGVAGKIYVIGLPGREDRRREMQSLQEAMGAFADPSLSRYRYTKLISTLQMSRSHGTMPRICTLRPLTPYSSVSGRHGSRQIRATRANSLTMRCFRGQAGRMIRLRIRGNCCNPMMLQDLNFGSCPQMPPEHCLL